MVNALFFIYSWFIFVPLMLLATVVAGAVCLCLVPFLGPRRVARLSAVPWARLGLLLSGVQVRVHGLENVDPSRSYVIVANHLSQYDIWVLYGHLEGGHRGLEFDFFDFSFLGPAYKLGPMGPIRNYREEERECATTSGKFNYFSLGPSMHRIIMMTCGLL